MRNPIAERLAADVAWVHSSVIRITEDLDEDFIHRRAGPRAPSIAFHLWHTARWADVVQAHLPGASPELERLGPGEEVPPWPLVQHFTFHLGHASRHMGMMEALKGALGRRGTATI